MTMDSRAQQSMDDETLTSDEMGLTRISPLSRRGFMTASVAVAAGYTLAAGPVRADVIVTDETGLETGNATIKVMGGDMPGYFARPKGVPNPPIVLVAMEVFGLHEYIKDVTRRLGKLGAFAVAPDYYFRAGTDLTRIKDIPQLMPIVNAKADSELLSDLDATAAWAVSQGGDGNRLGIIGFCRGGRAVWEYAAHSTQLKAGVAFYGSLVDPPNPLWPKSPTQLAGEMKAPVLGLYGAEDQGIPVAQVDAMKAALAAAGKTAEFRIFPGAPHGFHADYRPSYRKEPAEQAWADMQAWFKKYNVLG
ncbi:dienelactone hydrolase family protein [Afipia carboxidovorans]|uniref:dienelactone hydrolase family protein n=1 Tax=Afipia carboxidovorans TaxID=40137 RepID=UPI003088FAF8|nr:dienelactone hydrolase family protein [Afipia carboxidovorans]